VRGLRSEKETERHQRTRATFTCLCSPRVVAAREEGVPLVADIITRGLLQRRRSASLLVARDLFGDRVQNLLHGQVFLAAFEPQQLLLDPLPAVKRYGSGWSATRALFKKGMRRAV
jgi:hypothetical protein